MDEQQTCQTSAVLWMVLGPKAHNVIKTADLGSSMDGFGPRHIFNSNKTADLGSSMDGFGPNDKNHNKTAGPQQFYGWFWALWIECHQNCRPWQFYGLFWAQRIKATKLLDASSFMDGLGFRNHMSTKLRTLAVLWMILAQ